MIPVNTPTLLGNEKQYLLECVESGWISSEGPFVKQFEEKFSSRVGRKYGIAVSSGTAALDVAVESLGIQKGDEVILPTFTIISCIHQIVRIGAIPVLVDSNPDTWNMDISQIESKITENTRAIMAVHIYGLPVEMGPLLKICEKYGILLIEDAAEMIGQTYREKPCGSFGEISTFSFYPNKHITTGEGGMVVTDSEELAEKCRSLRNLCFQNKQRFVHERLGWNYRITNLQAAIGLAQLERLDESIVRKREIGRHYTALLSEVPGFQLPYDDADFAKNIFWVYGLVLLDERLCDAKTAMNLLEENNVGSRPFFWPLHKQPVLRKMGFFRNQTFPVAEKLAHRGFYIPSGLGLKNNQIEEVVTIIKEKIK
jgi:perosamine synthetase